MRPALKRVAVATAVEGQALGFAAVEREHGDFTPNSGALSGIRELFSVG